MPCDSRQELGCTLFCPGGDASKLKLLITSFDKGWNEQIVVNNDFGVALEMSEPSSEYVDRAVDLLKQGTSLLLSFMLMRFAGVSIECIIMLRLK